MTRRQFVDITDPDDPALTAATQRWSSLTQAIAVNVLILGNVIVFCGVGAFEKQRVHEHDLTVGLCRNSRLLIPWEQHPRLA